MYCLLQIGQFCLVVGVGIVMMGYQTLVQNGIINAERCYGDFWLAAPGLWILLSVRHASSQSYEPLHTALTCRLFIARCYIGYTQYLVFFVRLYFRIYNSKKTDGTKQHKQSSSKHAKKASVLDEEGGIAGSKID